MPILWSRQSLPYALALFIITGWLTLRSYTTSRDAELAFLSDADSFKPDSNKSPSGVGGGPNTPARPLLRPNKAAPASGSDPFLSTAPNPEALYEALVPTLQDMVHRVIPSYRDSLALETKRCPITHRQSNPDQVTGDGRWWATATVAELGAARSKLAADVVEALGFTADLEGPRDDKPRSMKTKLSTAAWKELFGKGGNGGRGLVFTAGNKDTANRLLTSLRILRKHLGCTLPAEVWGFASEIESMGDARTQIEELGGVTFHAVAQHPVPGLWKQFQIKGEAIRRSSFTSVLYLDSDNVAIRDPSFLFDTPLFKEHGVVLWPDYNKDGAANPIWRLTGAPCNATEWQVESGQLLINKLARGGLNLAALIMAEAMQRHPDFWFKISGGDKDTFRYAFKFLEIPYSPAPHWVAAAGALIPTFEGHRFCGHSMIQFGLSPAEWADTETDPDYEPPLAHAPPLFVHANLLKHSGYNNQRGSTFDYIKAANPDLTSVTNSRVMKDVRARVYNHRGMCADIWDSSSEANEGVGLQVEGAYDVGHVIIFDFGESSGGLLRNFEERYFSEGGVAGAW